MDPIAENPVRNFPASTHLHGMWKRYVQDYVSEQDREKPQRWPQS